MAASNAAKDCSPPNSFNFNVTLKLDKKLFSLTCAINLFQIYCIVDLLHRNVCQTRSYSQIVNMQLAMLILIKEFVIQVQQVISLYSSQMTMEL